MCSPRITCRTSFLLLDRRSAFRVALVWRRYPSYCRRSAARSSLGLMVVAPIALRIWRIDLRMASKKALLLHQMPTVSDLYRMPEGPCLSFAVSSAAIASDYSDCGMSGEPGLGCRRLTISQQGNDAPFQVADDAGVSVIAPPGPIVSRITVSGLAGGR